MEIETLSWQAIDRLIHLRFPQVPSLTIQELAAWLEQPHPPLLLDARQPAEYQVSHLPNARLLPNNLAELSGIRSPIVVYCSVGYRSARAVAALQALGLEAFNLKGSIFAWANAGYPVYRGAQPVAQVHPYNALWGKLLRSELHSDEASAAR